MIKGAHHTHVKKMEALRTRAIRSSMKSTIQNIMDDLMNIERKRQKRNENERKINYEGAIT